MQSTHHRKILSCKNELCQFSLVNCYVLQEVTIIKYIFISQLNLFLGYCNIMLIVTTVAHHEMSCFVIRVLVERFNYTFNKQSGFGKETFPKAKAFSV